MQTISGKLSLKERVGYSLGDTASKLFFQTFLLFLLYFYIDVFGLSAAAVGTMFLVTRIWDAFFDPIIGTISVRTHTRWGKFRPFLLRFALPFGIIGVLTFITPGFDTSSDKLVFAYVTCSLMMMFYSAINVPYSALMAVITPNPGQRTVLSSYKFVSAFAVDSSYRRRHGRMDAHVSWLRGKRPAIGGIDFRNYFPPERVPCDARRARRVAHAVLSSHKQDDDKDRRISRSSAAGRILSGERSGGRLSEMLDRKLFTTLKQDRSPNKVVQSVPRSTDRPDERQNKEAIT